MFSSFRYLTKTAGQGISISSTYILFLTEMQKKVRQRLICYTFNAIFHMERMISEAASLGTFIFIGFDKYFK